ncbi:MAG: caspase family protein, partial [Pseudomonadota bacterium]|nr:caspase family protein [Pseudomonadota bacterium]
MTRRIGLGTVVVMFMLAFASIATASVFQDGGKRVALVIGVSTYDNVVALPNPVNDAEAVAAALGRLGFEVHFHIDPYRSDFTGILGRFGAALEDADIAILYYAGHSIQIDGVNYLAPRDTRLEKAGDVDEFLLDIGILTGLMDRKAGVRITILDACRDNPFLETAKQSEELSGRGLNPGLAHISGPEVLSEGSGSDVYGSIIAYAAASGRTA